MNKRSTILPFGGLFLLGLFAAPVYAQTIASHPMTLGEALAITETHAQPVTAARATIASTRAQRLGAVAAFLPSLSISDQDQYYRPLQRTANNSTVVAGTLVSASQPFYNNATTANFSLNVYNGGKDVATYHASLDSLNSADMGLDAALNSSFEQVLGDFEALAADQATIATQGRIVALDSEIGQLTAQRMASQASSRIDLIQTQQQALAAETQLSQDRQQEMKDREQLERSMGYLAPAAPWRVEESLPPAPAVAPGRYPVLADPAVQSAYDQVLAAQLQVDAARAAYKPTVALVAQYNLLGLSTTAMGPALSATMANNYAVGISVSMPLLPFYNTVSAVDTARANVETNISAYQSALAAASSRGESAFQQYGEAQQGYELAVQSAQLAKANVDLTDSRYQAHRSSRIDVDRARLLAEQSDLSVITTKLSLRLSAWKLYRAAHPEDFAAALLQATARPYSSHLAGR